MCRQKCLRLIHVQMQVPLICALRNVGQWLKHERKDPSFKADHSECILPMSCGRRVHSFGVNAKGRLEEGLVLLFLNSSWWQFEISTPRTSKSSAHPPWGSFPLSGRWSCYFSKKIDTTRPELPQGPYSRLCFPVSSFLLPPKSGPFAAAPISSHISGDLTPFVGHFFPAVSLVSVSTSSFPSASKHM